MKSSLRTRSTRVLAVGAISVALLTAGTAGAFAAPAPSPSPKMTTPMPSPKMTGKPGKLMSPSPTRTKLTAKPTRTRTADATATISAKANKTDVKVGDPVTFTGRTSGLKIGATLSLQHYNGKKWIPVKTTTVKKGSVYSVTTKPVSKGAQKYRVSRGKTHSPEVTVTVK